MFREKPSAYDRMTDAIGDIGERLSDIEARIVERLSPRPSKAERLRRAVEREMKRALRLVAAVLFPLPPELPVGVVAALRRGRALRPALCPPLADRRGARGSGSGSLPRPLPALHFVAAALLGPSGELQERARLPAQQGLPAREPQRFHGPHRGRRDPGAGRRDLRDQEDRRSRRGTGFR